METVIIIGVVAGVITILGFATGIFRWLWRKALDLLNYLRRFRVDVPRDTIRAVPQPHRLRWVQINIKGATAMRLEGWWYVTNVSDRAIQITSVQLKRLNILGSVALSDDRSHTAGHREIPPQKTYAALTTFSIQPPKRKAPHRFRAKLAFADQYGNKFVTQPVSFEYESTEVREERKVPTEKLHTIENEVEKAVVAVLKSETYRYAECGRRVGGLGSIHIIQNGKSIAGLGTEWRSADSPDNQSILPASEESPIVSDNAATLITMYENLDEEDPRSVFTTALTNRVSGTNEYASVAYFILYVLFKLGHLSTAIDAAIQSLTPNKHGSGDFLMLLDGLLRFEHKSFSPDDLDLVGEYVSGLKEHTFRIEERIAAIRVRRLNS